MDKKKLPFGIPQCGCGYDLSHKKADIIGMKGSIPMGRCPKCDSPLCLVKVEAETIAEAKELEPEMPEAIVEPSPAEPDVTPPEE